MSIFILIPLLPLMAFLILALSGNRFGASSHRIGIPAVGLSFGLSVAALVSVSIEGPISIPLYRLIEAGSLVVDLNLYVDQLTVLLLLLVTGVSLVVHVYSSRYMIGDPQYRRFFALTTLFTFAMVTLVMSDNLLMTFMVWEIMGICSYLLISHGARKAAGRAATKAFLTNAVADIGFGFGVVLTFATYGTLDIQQILAAAPGISGQSTNLLAWLGAELLIETNTLLTLLLFAGAVGKSAQVPLHVWLPFAMEAPTPVSALIHAATMVNAGPFLLVRLSPLFLLAPTTMAVIAVVGGTTALYGALVSLTQTDIKKLLAYSTISQIGFMIFTCGVGAFVAAIFHLLAHGFLKGFLFLSTGNALRGVAAHGHDESHGGVDSPALRLLSPLSLGALLLACIPPLVLFAGPYERLWTAHDLPSARAAFWLIGLATVFFTAIYTFRGVISLFQQRFAVRDAETGAMVTIQPRMLSIAHVPGLVLAGVAGGALLMLLWSWLAGFLTPALGVSRLASTGSVQASVLSPWLLAPLFVSVAGWVVGYLLHSGYGLATLARTNWMKTLYVAFLNKLYFDEIYDAYIVRPVLRLVDWLWRVVDLRGVNYAVQGVGSVALWVARGIAGTLEARAIEGGSSGVGKGVVVLSRWLWGTIEARGVERLVQGSATSSLRLSDWLWRAVDRRATDQAIEGLGRMADDTGLALQKIEPRTLQHHLLLVVCWLILAIGLSYWFLL
jgi:NADH-quinone oxidoreductase subunit L